MTWLAVAGIGVAALTAGALKLRSYLRDSETEWDNWDTGIDLGTADDLAFDEAEHIRALAPKLTFVPDGFTCLGCHETDALPDSIWCAVCSERVRNFPSEPMERGQR